MNAIRALVRELPRTSRPLTAATAITVVSGPALRATMAVLTGLVVAAVPPAIADGLSSGAGRSLVLRIVLLGTAYSGLELCEALKSAFANALRLRLDRRLRHRVLEAVATAPGIAHLEDPRLLDLVDRARRVGPAQQTPGSAAAGLAQLGTRYLTCAAGFVMVATFRWWLAILAVAAMAVSRWAVGRYVTAVVDVHFEQTRGLRRAQYLADLALNPAAAKELRLFGLGDWLRERFTATWREAMGEVWRRRARMRRGVWLPLLLAMPTSIAFFVLLGRDVIDGSLELGQMGMLISAFGMLGEIASMSNADFDVAMGAGALPAVAELERVTDEMRASMRGAIDPVSMPARSIQFDRVSFRYPETQLDVLDGFDLELRAGESLAIVGSNGAGKTTLVKLLARLYDPTAGTVVVDGHDLRDVEPVAWQRRIGAIFQDFTRYELTAAENVGFGAPHLLDDREALRRAAARAGALEIIESLPDGWDTVLSRQVEGGAELSGGEWQRVALARALLAVDGGAGLLILDEPTANLDARAEADLYDRFLELTRGVTTIVISHRFSTVRRADRIVVLRGGRVVEQGSHDELLALGGRYARMFRLQAARFTVTEDTTHA